MKKIALSLLFVAMASGVASAQAAKKRPVRKPAKTSAATVAPAQANPAPAAQAPTAGSGTLSADNLVFVSDNHNFGTVAEGGAADHTFTFKNTGKEPIVITQVKPSCGCTTPDWTKEPILPGKTGVVKASYGTQGRPGPFTKTLTVMSNAGSKVLTISGTVEKAPTSSVPANGSMMKSN